MWVKFLEKENLKKKIPLPPCCKLKENLKIKTEIWTIAWVRKTPEYLKVYIPRLLKSTVSLQTVSCSFCLKQKQVTMRVNVVISTVLIPETEHLHLYFPYLHSTCNHICIAEHICIYRTYTYSTNTHTFYVKHESKVKENTKFTQTIFLLRALSWNCTAEKVHYLLGVQGRGKRHEYLKRRCLDSLAWNLNSKFN